MRSASEDRPGEDEIRNRRVEVARRNSHWIELNETELVRRGPLLVHAETDEVFKVRRGVVWQTGSASVIFNEQIDMHFYVHRDGELVFLERMRETWSDIVAKRAKRRSGVVA